MSFSDFIARISEIAEWVDAHVRTKKPEVRADISKAIDTAIAHDAPVVQYILAHPNIPKTPLYHLHRGIPKLAGAKYRSAAPALSPKQRMRKQNFLALVDYLREKKEVDVVEVEPRFFRSSRTYAIFTRERGERHVRSGKLQKIELRIWKYHREEIEEEELDEEWSDAYANATLAFGDQLIGAMREIFADELNEEVDKDEGSDWEAWQKVLWFSGIAYDLNGNRDAYHDGEDI